MIKVNYNARDFKRFIDKKLLHVNDMSVPMKKASIWLDRWVQANFKSEGGNVGGWKKFKYGGRVSDKGIDFAAKLLQDTGRLKASFKPFSNKFNGGVASDLKYSKYHENGEGVPQRRMLPKRSEVKEELKKILKKEAFKNF